ncbi:MAG: hypothetical protein ABSG56_15425 [Bryobacteraceae bacterium]|jgi:hypothetical protein
MKERTPQEKKSLSLAKDRRNVYGEAPHGARKSIPLRKKLRNRANRHSQESKLPSEPTPFDADQADEMESSMHDTAPQHWAKYPDAPLGDVLAKKQRWRATPKSIRTRTVIAKPREP